MNREQPRPPQRPAGKGRSLPPPEPITPRPVPPPPPPDVADHELVAPQSAAPPPPSTRKAVYTVIEPAGGGKSRWVRIGIAFVNRDGSYNVLLDALPVTGTLHIRDFPPREGDEASAE